MNSCLPRDITTDAEGGKTEPATGTPIVRHLIVLMLLTTATLDLTRCDLVMAAAGRRWAGWAALLIGLASVPQAAASGFRSPYLIPDAATAALGILLAVTVLATAGRMDRRDTTPEILLAKRR